MWKGSLFVLTSPGCEETFVPWTEKFPEADRSCPFNVEIASFPSGISARQHGA